MPDPNSIRSLREQVEDVPLTSEGSIPSYVSGCLVRNGPALFEFGEPRKDEGYGKNQTVKHWFDGQAMIHGFSIKAGEVKYTNKFLDSHNLRVHTKAGKVAMREFGTDPCATIFGRFFSLFKQDKYENANVSVKQMGERLFAMTEVPAPMEIKIPNMQTVGPCSFTDDFEEGQVSTAHPHTFKGEEGEEHFVNYVTRFGPKSFHVLFDVQEDAEGRLRRTEIAKLEDPNPFYMHSFGMTENYYILCESAWKFSMKCFIKTGLNWFFRGKTETALSFYKWPKAPQPTQFLVFSKKTGELVKRVPTGHVFFAFHFINCYEKDGEVAVDLMTYNKPFYEDLTLENFRKSGAIQQDMFTNTDPKVRRYTFGVANAGRSTTESVGGGKKGGWEERVGAAKLDVIYEGVCELPTIDYDRKNAKDYTFVYGLESGKFEGTEGLIKINVKTKETWFWQNPDCSPGEPIFVKDTLSEEEDGGCVLSVVFDREKDVSFLLTLDGKSFKELARNYCGHHIPPGLHGTFVTSKK